MEDLLSFPVYKARNAFVAFLLSICTPGLGQLYNGQPKKAGLFFASTFILPLLFSLTNLLHTYGGFVFGMLLIVAVWLYVMIDAVVWANRQKAYVAKSYNKRHWQLLLFAAYVAWSLCFNIHAVLGIQTFAIPTGSNVPTIQVGDYIVADIKAYKDHGPEYGDFVVYRGDDGNHHIFRAVGLPNDRLALSSDIISINGTPCNSAFIKDTMEDNMPMKELEEELPVHRKHKVYVMPEPYDKSKVNITSIVVPANCYYLLGDDRDNAMDSRYVGFISRERIVGKVMYSYWGASKSRINIDFRNN